MKSISCGLIVVGIFLPNDGGFDTKSPGESIYNDFIPGAISLSHL